MLQIALAQVRLHARRFVAIALAVLLAVAFLVATLLVNSSTQATLKASVGQSFAKADVVLVGGKSKPLGSEALKASEKIPGVAASYGQISLSVQAKTESSSFNALLKNSPADQALEASTLISGAFPTAPGQAVIDEETAKRNSLQLGSELTITSSDDQSAPVKITGIMQASADPMSSGSAQLLAASQTVAPLASTPMSYANIQLKLDGGLSDAKRAEISQALNGAGYADATVRSADEETNTVMKGFTGGNDSLTLVLLAFAAIAIIVAVLVVSNTFSVLVAQRTRELALLRCVGAKKSQIRNSVLVEAVVVGFIASAAGVALALAGMALLIKWISSMPQNRFATFEANWQAVVIGLVVGILLTIGAALIPARAATSVAPLAAMRPTEDAALSNRGGKVRLTVGGLLIGLGGLLLAAGAISTNLAFALPGGAMTFFGVLLCGSLFIPRLVATFGKLAAPAGVPGKLAALNAVRSPGRTTATASALLIGVTLVSMMLTGASTARSAFSSTLDDRYPVDVTADAGHYTPGQIAGLKSLNGVAAVAQLPIVGTIDNQGASVPVLGISSADAAAVIGAEGNRVQPGKLLMPKSTTDTSKSITLPSGSKELPVVGSNSRTFGSMVNLATIPAPADAKAEAWIKLVPGLSGAQILDLRGQVAKTLGVQDSAVNGGALEKASFNQVIDILLLVVTALLGIAVLIALIGVANTLSLSVLERTRENALLRALGLTRRGLRGMLALEAVLIAGVAALIGVALGTLYGWLGAQSALGSFATVLPNVPWLELLVVVGIAAVAGLAASVVPARRAARLSPVEGLATE